MEPEKKPLQTSIRHNLRLLAVLVVLAVITIAAASVLTQLFGV